MFSKQIPLARRLLDDVAGIVYQKSLQAKNKEKKQTKNDLSQLSYNRKKSEITKQSANH